MIKQLKLVTASLILCATPLVQAAQCDSNFSASGNMLRGKVFKTSADLPGLDADKAYKRTYLAIVKQGFMLQQHDSTMRFISARNNGSTADRPQTLNAMLEPVADGAQISLTFTMPPGAIAAENTIRTEFCKLVNSVMEQ